MEIAVIFNGYNIYERLYTSIFQFYNIKEKLCLKQN